MTLDDMKELANRSTGLVVMTVKRGFAPWRPGDVAGFPPETALDHLNNDIAVLGVKSKGDFGRPAPKPVTAKMGMKPAAVTSKSIPVTTETEKGDKVTVPALPKDWRDHHPLQVIKMAHDNGFDRTTVKDGERVSDRAREFLEEFEKTAAEATAKPTE